jgi:nucleotide-binding universal stress UspA family protein
MQPFRRLLVPHDLSDYADDALDVASQLAGPEGEILVLHVVVPYVPTAQLPAVAIQLPLAEMKADAARHLRRVVAQRVGTRGPKTRIEVVIDDPYRGIVEHSRGCDAIVMSTRGRTGLAHLLMGSVAEKIVRHSEIPVLTLRPDVARRLARSRTPGSRRRAA